MNTKWLEGTTGEDRENLKTYIEGNKKLLDILSKIVYNRVRGKEKTSIADYDNAAWPYKQAHVNGDLEACQWFIKLLDVTASD